MQPPHEKGFTLLHANTMIASYMILGSKYNYGVDYGNYMHRLAEEIDSAPQIRPLLSDPKLLLTYAMGQAHGPVFRLRGPFASEACKKICRTELWEVIKQRGWLENLGLSLMNLLFLGINLGMLGLELGVCVGCWLFGCGCWVLSGGQGGLEARKSETWLSRTRLWINNLGVALRSVPFRGFDRYG